MPLSWEALTALASLISSLAVLAAVLVAMRQVRVGAQQVEHLRKATQLDGTMKIFEKLGSPEQQRSRHFIANELAQRMTEPAFRASMEHVAYLPEQHPGMVALRLLEMVGTYVKHGLIDDDIVFDYWYPAIVNTWERLEDLGVIAIHRGAGGPTLWENFEELYRRARRWVAIHDPTSEARAWTTRPTAPAAAAAPEPAGTKS